MTRWTMMALLPAALLAAPALAESGPLVTDRPDFTESAEAVPGGRFQLESGVTFETVRDEGTTATFGELLFRVGLGKSAELRLGVNSFALSCKGEDCVYGFEDSYVGAKLAFLANEGARPGLALLIGTSLPTGAPDIGGDPLQPHATLALAWDLSPVVAMGINAGYTYGFTGVQRINELAGSLSFGFGLSDVVGVYAEYFGFYPLIEGTPTSHFGNGGATFTLTDDFQLDVRAGGGAAGGTPAFFAGAGFALRI